jgi:hypothetical protein
MADEPINWKAHRRMNVLVDGFMRFHHRPPTREEYIDLAYGEKEMPEEWTAEHESMLPEPLRRSVDPPARRER